MIPLKENIQLEITEPSKQKHKVWQSPGKSPGKHETTELLNFRKTAENSGREFQVPVFQQFQVALQGCPLFPSIPQIAVSFYIGNSGNLNRKLESAYLSLFNIFFVVFRMYQIKSH